jgi:acetyl/propionyl-CoA carboxylase alpha subunit
MAEAALVLGRKIGYTNAGTVEFLLAPSGEFYFIEVNTRIQVENPVTEMITGLDLIRLQIEIAQGSKLPAQPRETVGHAIEARLYAEDPNNNFLPSTGTLHVWQPPRGLEGVRVDSGVEERTEIGVYYDPLLAKVIAHAPDRNTAVNKLAFALRDFAAQGLTTNRDFLIDVLENADFRAGHAHTGFQLPSRVHDDAERKKDLVCSEVVAAYIERTEHAQRKVLPSIPVRFRNNPYPSPAMKFSIHGREVEARKSDSVEVLGVEGERVDALVDQVRYRFQIRRHGDNYFVHSNFAQRTVTRLSRYPGHAGARSHESANSPMPGQVLRILVSEGQTVKPGDPLVSLEAMKMEQTIKATMDGVVRAILVKAGQVVAPGQLLVEIDSTEDANVDADANRSAANR